MNWGKLIGATMSLGGGIIGAKSSAKQAKEQRNYERQQAELDRAEMTRQFNEQLGQRKAEFGNEQQMQAARKAAYESMLTGGASQQGVAEKQLMGETSQASPELLQAEKDMLAGTTEGIQTAQNQMQANLAQQGVRGGQAATQLRRGVGDIMTSGIRDINAMKTEDAAKRQAIRSAYLASKGSQATAATLSPATF